MPDHTRDSHGAAKKIGAWTLWINPPLEIISTSHSHLEPPKRVWPRQTSGARSNTIMRRATRVSGRPHHELVGQTVWVILNKGGLPQTVTVADVQDYAGELEICFQEHGKKRWVVASCWNRERNPLLAHASRRLTAAAPAFSTSSVPSPVQGGEPAEDGDDDDMIFGSDGGEDDDEESSPGASASSALDFLPFPVLELRGGDGAVAGRACLICAEFSTSPTSTI